MKTSDLTGPALDWAVSEAEYQTDPPRKGWVLEYHKTGQQMWPYSTSWEWGGPIIERERTAHWPDEEGGWLASSDAGRGHDYHGPTPLIAAMRCYVASRLGDEVEIPKELK